MAFDLTSCWCAGLHSHRPIGGDVQLQMMLSTPAVNALSIVMISCYENNITILNCAVTLDYTL